MDSDIKLAKPNFSKEKDFLYSFLERLGFSFYPNNLTMTYFKKDGGNINGL